MKWFLAIVLVLNLLIGVYGVSRDRSAPVNLRSQEVSPNLLKLLPPDWQPPVPASGPLSASAPQASAPQAQQPASAASAKVPTKTSASAPKPHASAPKV